MTGVQTCALPISVLSISAGFSRLTQDEALLFPTSLLPVNPFFSSFHALILHLFISYSISSDLYLMFSSPFTEHSLPQLISFISSLLPPFSHMSISHSRPPPPPWQATCRPSAWCFRSSAAGGTRLSRSPPSPRNWWCAGS